MQKKIVPGGLTDALGRFHIWSGNIGAHRKGKSSLDYRLREASHIRDRVIDLLRNLLVVIGGATEIINGNIVPWEYNLDASSDSDSDSGSNASTIDDEADIVFVSTELAQLLGNMTEINTCLMRLSMAIRTPAPHDQCIRSKGLGVAHFEAYDVEHVREKFPNAPDYLAIRMGKAASRRRQYLRYRENHRRRLGLGLNTAALPGSGSVGLPLANTTASSASATSTTAPSGTGPSQRVESTLASPIPDHMRVQPTMPEINEDDHDEGARSLTTYASAKPNTAKLRPPLLPESADGGETFECPLCYRMTSVERVMSWHKHVYRDLKPYVS